MRKAAVWTAEIKVKIERTAETKVKKQCVVVVSGDRGRVVVYDHAGLLAGAARPVRNGNPQWAEEAKLDSYNMFDLSTNQMKKHQKYASAADMLYSKRQLKNYRSSSIEHIMVLGDEYMAEESGWDGELEEESLGEEAEGESSGGDYSGEQEDEEAVRQRGRRGTAGSVMPAEDVGGVTRQKRWVLVQIKCEESKEGDPTMLWALPQDNPRLSAGAPLGMIHGTIVELTTVLGSILLWSSGTGGTDEDKRCDRRSAVKWMRTRDVIPHLAVARRRFIATTLRDQNVDGTQSTRKPRDIVTKISHKGYKFNRFNRLGMREIYWSRPVQLVSQFGSRMGSGHNHHNIPCPTLCHANLSVFELPETSAGALSSSAQDFIFSGDFSMRFCLKVASPSEVDQLRGIEEGTISKRSSFVLPRINTLQRHVHREPQHVRRLNPPVILGEQVPGPRIIATITCAVCTTFYGNTSLESLPQQLLRNIQKLQNDESRSPSASTSATSSPPSPSAPVVGPPSPETQRSNRVFVAAKGELLEVFVTTEKVVLERRFKRIENIRVLPVYEAQHAPSIRRYLFYRSDTPRRCVVSCWDTGISTKHSIVDVQLWIPDGKSSPEIFAAYIPPLVHDAEVNPALPSEPHGAVIFCDSLNTELEAYALDCRGYLIC